MLLPKTVDEDFALSEGATFVGVGEARVALKDIQHLHITQLYLILLRLVFHQLQFVICFVHVCDVEVILLLLEL